MIALQKKRKQKIKERKWLLVCCAGFLVYVVAHRV